MTSHNNSRPGTTLPGFARLFILTLLCSSIVACHNVEAPRPGNNDDHDASDNHDAAADTHEEPDTTPLPTCTPNEGCHPTKEFCNTDNTCQRYPQLALGSAHSCSLNDKGDVYCWGQNSQNQLGIGATSENIQTEPTQVILEEPAKLISTGYANTCVVLNSDAILCWGYHSLSNEVSAPISALPTPINHDLTDPTNPIVQIVSGYAHHCVLHDKGDVYCWGHNEIGQLGIGTTGGSTTLKYTQKVAITPTPTQLAATLNQTCALTEDATIQCWGANQNGQLGIINDDRTTQSKPALIPGITNAIEVATGAEHICTRHTDSTIRCWGSNQSAQLGNPGLPYQLPPSDPTLAGSFQQIATGLNQTFALEKNGTLYVTGNNHSGDLGTGTTTVRYYTFTRNPEFTDLNPIHHLITGPRNNCAIHPNGTTSCWGSNTNGNVGTGSAGGNIISPTLITIP